MSLPAAPLFANANNPQGVGHPDTVSTRITATNGLLPGQFPAVNVVQTDLTTPGSTAALALRGGGGPGGPVGSSDYILYKTCGPSAGGLVPDHLQLFRYGPTGAVNPTISEILDIAPKLVATPGLPATEIATLFADLTVNGALVSGLGSFQATNPPVDVAAAVGYNTMVLAGFRFIWGRVISNSGGANPGLFAAVFPSSLVRLNTDGSIQGIVSLAMPLATDLEQTYTARFNNYGRIVGTNSYVDGQARNYDGLAQGTSVNWLIICTAP